MSEDRIRTLLEKYREQSEAEYDELFLEHKKPVRHEGPYLFVCSHCKKMKIRDTIRVIVILFDKSELCFCTQICYGRWKNSHPELNLSIGKKIGGHGNKRIVVEIKS